MIPTGEATAILPTGGKTKPITVIGTDKIRETFDEICLQQAINSRLAPGVTDLVLNPDGHCGYGAPIGCVMTSPTHIYPWSRRSRYQVLHELVAVGFARRGSSSLAKFAEDLSMRFANAHLPAPAVGNAMQPSLGRVDEKLGKQSVIEGASESVCSQLGIPPEWATRCEDAAHVGHDETTDSMASRLDWHLDNGTFRKFSDKALQLGSYGGGNHFGECEIVHVEDNARARQTAGVFGLKDRHVAFLSHCGSRGVGHNLAMGQFKALQNKFATWDIPLPGNDRELVYAPLGTKEADSYIDDMSLGANFATVNHLLINALVLEAFQEVFPGINGQLVYFISHNIARREIVNNIQQWVHRKGATRAFPAGHHALKGTRYAQTGHPILLPGNPQAGSSVMVADPGASISCYSVNHGAGRQLGRKRAIRELDQASVDASFEAADILTNCRQYPKDEAPAAYKDFEEVLRSVKLAGLATEVARLKATFVIKDGDAADD